MIERVTHQNLDEVVARYIAARGGENTEQTDSEAMFVAGERFRGLYFFNQHLKYWIGVSNASARASYNGIPAPDVRAAVARMLSLGHEVHYTDEVVERLRWMTDRIAEWKADSSFLLVRIGQ